MSFLVQRVAAGGLQLVEVPGDVLSIGRGTRAVLRSENPAVSLDHANIVHDEGGYTIIDLGSITGTYVNGRPVESTRLGKGDVIEIGDLHIDVQSADANKPLIVRVTRTRAQSSDFEEDAVPAVAMPGVASLKAPKIDYAGEYRLKRSYLTKAAVTAALVIFCIVVIGEITQPKKQTVFQPGGVSSAHSRFRDTKGEPMDCQVCHEPFAGATSSRCEGCHGPMLHAENQEMPPPCTSCHAEHRGQGRLASISDNLCVDCHGNIAAHMRQAHNTRNVVSFGMNHPEFTYAPDNDTLRLNHKLHLQKGGIRNAQGMFEELTCTFCHGMFTTRGKIDPAPVKFNDDCKHCHKLTFGVQDAKGNDLQVPHGGDPDNALGYILAAYSGNAELLNASEEQRRILTARRQLNVGERVLIDAEHVIKDKCGKCHVIHPDAKGRPVVTPPVIPTRWLDAKYSHGPHRSLSCEMCHGQAANSTKTSDILMPQRSACVGCHSDQSGTLLVASTRSRTNNCVLCHEYHVHSNNSLPRFSPRSGLTRADVGGGSGMLQSILFAAAVVLLLVVFVPVGLALYQRMKPSRGERNAERRTEPVPPLPTGPTAKVPPIQAPPPPAPKRAPHVDPPTPPQIGSTRLITPDEPAAGPQATEAVVWFGMLRCTAGPLEGQTFIIEEDGIYIGRDPTLSKIVVDDSRVSKRHLRIVPRDGKVWAIDQNSTNGTFLVSSAGRERITEHQLKRGESIVLADDAATFMYQI